MKIKITLVRNKNRADAIVLSSGNIKNFTPSKIAVEMRRSFCFHFEKICKQRIDEMMRKIKERPLDPTWLAEHSEEVTLKRAYEQALTASRMYSEGHSTRFNVMSLNVLDNLLPMSRGIGGWWRLHESGVPSAVSDIYGFAPRGLLDRIFGNKLQLAGRFGEGYMVDKNDSFWSRFNLKSGGTIKPKRYLRTMQKMVMNDIKLNKDFFDRVIETTLVKLVNGGRNG